jgi:hypothetical protein
MVERERAQRPEDVSRLVVERSRAGDAEGIAALYAPDAVLAYPPGEVAVGRDAIRAVYERLIRQAPPFRPEDPLPTLLYRDLALTSTRSRDGTGGRVQVVRHEPDGSWVRIIDRPEMPS